MEFTIILSEISKDINYINILFYDHFFNIKLLAKFIISTIHSKVTNHGIISMKVMSQQDVESSKHVRLSFYSCSNGSFHQDHHNKNTIGILEYSMHFKNHMIVRNSRFLGFIKFKKHQSLQSCSNQVCHFPIDCKHYTV